MSRAFFSCSFPLLIHFSLSHSISSLSSFSFSSLSLVHSSFFFSLFCLYTPRSWPFSYSTSHHSHFTFTVFLIDHLFSFFPFLFFLLLSLPSHLYLAILSLFFFRAVASCIHGHLVTLSTSCRCVYAFPSSLLHQLHNHGRSLHLHSVQFSPRRVASLALDLYQLFTRAPLISSCFNFDPFSSCFFLSSSCNSMRLTRM